MSSSDERLKKKFEEDLNAGNDDSAKATVDSIIEWLRSLQVFNKTSIQEYDIRKAYEKLKKRTPTVNFKDFTDILAEVAKKSKIELGVLKEQLLNLIYVQKNEEKEFIDKFKRGVATGKDVLAWVERNSAVAKVKDKLKFSQEDFQNAYNSVKQRAASSVTRENLITTRQELEKKLRDLAALPSFNLEEFIHNLWEYYVSPLSESDDEESKDERHERKN